MKLLQNQVLKNEGNKPILYDVFYKKNSLKKPVVIFCHGYKGFKDWGAWNLVGKEFAKNNFAFIKFNFSHNGGTIKNPIDFPDLEAFGNNNFSYELNDIEIILESLIKNKDFKNDFDFNDISLIGHSRGAGSVIIKASENKKISKVISWAGVSDFKVRFNEGSNEFDNWKKKGVMYVENARTKQLMPHYFQFFQDFKKNEERFNIKSAVEKLKIPFLIIHGSKDNSVLPGEGENLFSWSKSGEIQIIEGSDHVFKSKHPWQSKKLPEDLKKVVYLTINFLKKN